MNPFLSAKNDIIESMDAQQNLVGDTGKPNHFLGLRSVLILSLAGAIILTIDLLCLFTPLGKLILFPDSNGFVEVVFLMIFTPIDLILAILSLVFFFNARRYEEKDPQETVYLRWALGLGIYMIALLLVALFVFLVMTTALGRGLS